jgi:hypothetical protein
MSIAVHDLVVVCAVAVVVYAANVCRNCKIHQVDWHHEGVTTTTTTTTRRGG